MAEKVVLHLYDLSQGMAKNMSRQFLGKQIDGIWHTGIVVFGKEFYFGGGICKDPPGQTPYGNPIQKINLGETEIPEDIFLEFLQEINPQFTAEKYDLFENNCNNFTDACSEFLIGSKIPNHITGLPKEVLATPMGKMLKPMIDNMQKNMNQQSHPMFGGQGGGQQNFGGQNNGFGGINPNAFGQGGFNPNNLGGFNPSAFGQNGFGGFGGNNQAQSTGSGPVLHIVSPDEFSKLLKSSPAVIVDFFSDTCGPCKVIKPVFEKMAQRYQTACPGLKFVSVDTSKAQMLSMTYQIKSIPTFIGFFEGTKIQQFSGADAKKLESLAFSLEAKINAKNPKNLSQEPEAPSFQIFNPNKKDFYTFSGVNYPLPIKNINGVLESFEDINKSDSKEIYTRFAQNPQDNVKAFSKEEKVKLIEWILSTVFQIGISDKTIGFLDLLRMLSLDISFLEIILENPAKIQSLIKFLEKSEQELKDIPKGLKLVLLRLITNISASEKSKALFQNNINAWSELFVRAGNVFRDDKPSLYPILMTFWNTVQNLSSNKDLKDVFVTIAHFNRVIFADSTDNEVLLGCNLIHSWLSFTIVDIKKETDAKIDKAKLAKLEFSEDSNVAKSSRDLADILKA